MPYGQSPPTTVVLPSAQISAPMIASGLSLRLEGAVEVRDVNGQQETVRLYDEDDDVFDTIDDLLDEILFDLAIPDDAWEGLLVPYSVTSDLYHDGNGNIAGLFGTSDETEIQAYQVHVRDWATDIESPRTQVPE